MAQKTDIDVSRKYYDDAKIDLCTCTPPTSICTWGILCGNFLRNRTDEKIHLLERAAKSQDSQLRIQLQDMQKQSYCGHGITPMALKQGAAEEFMVSTGDTGQAAENMYSASLVLAQRNEIVGKSSDTLSSCFEAGCCGPCETCNDAYVVNDAVNNFLTGNVPNSKSTPASKPVIKPPKPVSTELQMC